MEHHIVGHFGKVEAARELREFGGEPNVQLVNERRLGLPSSAELIDASGLKPISARLMRRATYLHHQSGAWIFVDGW